MDISNHTLEAVRRTGHDAAGIKPDFTQRQAWHHLTASVMLPDGKRDVTRRQAWRYLTASVMLPDGRHDTKQAKNRELEINRLQEYLINNLLKTKCL